MSETVNVLHTLLTEHALAQSCVLLGARRAFLVLAEPLPQLAAVSQAGGHLPAPSQGTSIVAPTWSSPKFSVVHDIHICVCVAIGDETLTRRNRKTKKQTTEISINLILGPA